MSNILKKSVSVLLAVVMLIGLFPAVVFAEGEAEGTEDGIIEVVDDGSEEVVVPEAEEPEAEVTESTEPEVVETPEASEALPERENTAGSLGGQTYYENKVGTPSTAAFNRSTVGMKPSYALPAAYSSVTAGRAGAVKDQNPYGSCWAHSATTACENSLFRNTGDREVLSVLQLVNYFYNDKLDPLGNALGDGTYNTMDTKLDTGGNDAFTLWALAGWTNGALESTLPYTSENCNAVNNDILPNTYAYDYDIGHLQNAYMLNYSTSAQDLNNMKEAVMEYGSVSVNYYHDDAYMNYDTYCYYFPYANSNHAVSVVGWNDNFPKESFSVTPPGDGAWLVQNSWGTRWGTDGDADPADYWDGNNAGYFWMSYYDGGLLYNETVYVYDFYPASTYQHNYQYDGSTSPYYYGIPAGGYTATTFTVSGISADVERLDAVGVGLFSTDAAGTVRIYKNPTSEDPTSGTLVSSTPFATTFAGYYTIPIENGPEMRRGETFSVLIQWDTEAYVACDADLNGNWIYFVNDVTGDRSYLFDEYGFYDTTEEGATLRIKAYTNDVQSTAPSVDYEYRGESLSKEYDGEPVVLDLAKVWTNDNFSSEMFPLACSGLYNKYIEAYYINEADGEMIPCGHVEDWATETEVVTGPSEPGDYCFVFVRPESWGEDKNTDIYLTIRFTISGSIAVAPAAPVVAGAYDAATESIKLTWNAVEGAVKYEVYRLAPAATGYTLVKTTETAGYVDNAIEAGKTYQYKVVAVSEEGLKSEDSNVVIVEVPAPVAPAAPVVTGAYDEATESIKLTWNIVEGAVKYEVYRLAPNETAFTRVSTVGMLGYVDEAIEAGKTYQYKVIAVSEEGLKSEYSNVVTVEVPAPVPPAAPVVTGAYDAATESIKLTWNAVEGAVKYEVYRLAPAATGYTLVKTTETAGYVDNAIEAGKTYQYKVVAVSEEGLKSEDSNVVIVEVPAPVPPAAPVVIGTYNAETKSVNLDWRLVDDAVKYEVYRADSAEAAYILLGTTDKASFTDATIVRGETYLYKVIAVSEEGLKSEDSNVVTVETPAPVPPAAPVVTGTYNAETKSVNLDWRLVDDAVKYEVYRADSAEAAYILLGTTDKASFTDATIVRGETYLYKVIAVSEEGLKSEDSNVVTVETPAPVPPAAPVLTAEFDKATSSVKLTWNAAEDVTEYLVMRADAKNGNFALIGTCNDKSSFTDKSIQGETTYQYKVIAVGEEELKAESNVVSVTIPVLNPPARPNVFTSHDLNSGKNKLTWKTVDGAAAFKIYRSTTKNGEYVLLDTVETTSFIDESAVAGGTYYYKVASVGSTGLVSECTSPVMLTCDLARTTTEITTMTISGCNRVKWGTVPNATTYKIYRSTSKVGGYTLIKSVKQGTTYYTDTTGVPGTTYYYYVIAAIDGKSAANSAKSVLVSATCRLGRPDMSLTAGYSRITLKWNRISGATGYKIYRSTSLNGEYSLVKTITSGSTTSWVNTGLKSGTRYYYKVVAVKSGSEAATSVDSVRKSTVAK